MVGICPGVFGTGGYCPGYMSGRYLSGGYLSLEPTRHRNTVEPIMLADNRKATLQAIHTDAVNKAVKDHKKNIVLDDLPYPINDSEKDLTGKERAALEQL